MFALKTDLAEAPGFKKGLEAGRTRIRKRIVRYLGVLTLLGEASLWPSSGYSLYSPHMKAQHVGGHRFAESIPHLGSQRDSFFMSAIYRPDLYVARWGKYPIPINRMLGKVKDDKEARETTRPKIDQTAFKTGQRGCPRRAKTAPRGKFPPRSRGKDQISQYQSIAGCVR